MTTPTDILSVLAKARPDGLNAPDRQVRDRIYLAALAAPAISRQRRQPHRRLLVVPVASAGVLAAVLIVALGVQPFRTVAPPAAHGSPNASTRTSARAVLLAAASVVEKAPTASAGTYWHTSTQVFEAASGSSPSHTSVMDDWIARSPNDPSWFTLPIPGKSQVHQAGAAADDPYHTRFDVLDRFLTFAEIQQLPTDPAGLRAYLLAIPPHHQDLAAAPVSDRLFIACTQLAEAPATPAVRAAAYQLLADLPGLTALGQVHDPEGRIGVGVADSFASDVTAVEVIIDPSTGSLLALQNLAHVNGQSVVTYYEAILAGGWTNTVDPSSGAA